MKIEILTKLDHFFSKHRHLRHPPRKEGSTHPYFIAHQHIYHLFIASLNKGTIQHYLKNLVEQDLRELISQSGPEPTQYLRPPFSSSSSSSAGISSSTSGEHSVIRWGGGDANDNDDDEESYKQNIEYAIRLSTQSPFVSPPCSSSVPQSSTQQSSFATQESSALLEKMKLEEAFRIVRNYEQEQLAKTNKEKFYSSDFTYDADCQDDVEDKEEGAMG